MTRECVEKRLIYVGKEITIFSSTLCSSKSLLNHRNLGKAKYSNLSQDNNFCAHLNSPCILENMSLYAKSSKISVSSGTLGKSLRFLWNTGLSIFSIVKGALMHFS